MLFISQTVMYCDPSLAARISKGDHRAFQSAYELFADKIYRVSRRFHLDEDDAKEIVQDVFMVLWEKREGLDSSLSLNAFLLTITKNKIINANKKKASEIARNYEWAKLAQEWSISTENILIFSDLERLTQQFIDSLSPRRKQIFTLSRTDGITNDEIADLLNVSKRTVENNIYQAEKEINLFLTKNRLITRCIPLTALFFDL
jgi:RNA polymerase sigma-70 factor (ECF subfamily)